MLIGSVHPDYAPPPSLEREPHPTPGMQEYRIIEPTGMSLRLEIAERHFTPDDLLYLHAVLERIAGSGIDRDIWPGPAEPGAFVPKLIR